MPGELTDADHRVRFHHSHVASGLVPAQETIRAAYVTTEDKQLPGMLVFKDRNHQVVAILSKDAVLAVDRLEPEHAAAKEISEGGFQPTSQVMTHMNPGVPGAAGAPQTLNWEIPAGGGQ